MPLRPSPLVLVLIAAVPLAGVAVPAAAQLGQSEGYKFLQAVKDSKNDEVRTFLEKPGTTVINTRDSGTGEGAIHIVVRRGDVAYLGYLLARGADANLRDGKGETGLMIAARLNRIELMDMLVKSGANPNLANASGETPLIVAVQRRDAPMARTILALGGDPDQKDRLQGFSARDYAHQDTRAPAIATMIDAAPKTVRRAVSGPKL